MKRMLLPLFGLTLLVSGCGWSVETAREAAAQRTCDYYARCNEIGPGRNYESRDTCLTKQRSNWLDLWSTDACVNRINSANLDMCLRAIDNTQCGNVLDYLATLSKCQRSDVCK
jgi:hypothetical protein